MTHTCEDCGEEFETLSGLRLHDCPAEEDESQSGFLDAIERSMAERSEKRRQRDREVVQAAPAELTDPLDRALEGEHDALYDFLAVYERELAGEYGDEDGDYWSLQRGFYAPATSALESAVESEGWPFLLEILDAYWPETELDFSGYEEYSRYDDYQTRYADREVFPHVDHVLTNATGRWLIRTRRADGVEAIPEDALAYMALFHCHPGDGGAWVDSIPYGWGIGHPDHSVVETVAGAVEGAFDVWAGAVVEHAFHADQGAAIGLLETVFSEVEVSDPAMLFRGIANIDQGCYPSEPKHVDWETLYPEFETKGFDFDPDVRERIRDLVEDAGVFGRRHGDWTFADLEV